VEDEEKKVQVIKDSWVEDRPRRQMECDIVTKIKHDVGGDEEFHRYYINTCGHQKTDTPGGFKRLWENLKTQTFVRGHSKPHHLIPTSKVPAEHSAIPPHPRFCYQVIYDKMGISLFEVTSFPDVCPRGVCGLTVVLPEE